MLLAVHIYRVMDALGKFGEHERSVRVARGTAKSMNQFFYNIATKTWALKHVLFLIDHNYVLTMDGEGKQRSLLS